MPRQTKITPKLEKDLRESYQKTNGIVRYGIEYMREDLGYDLKQSTYAKLLERIGLEGKRTGEGIDELILRHFEEGISDPGEMATLVSADIEIEQYFIKPEATMIRMTRLGLRKPGNKGGARAGFKKGTFSAGGVKQTVGRKPKKGYEFGDNPDTI